MRHATAQYLRVDRMRSTAIPQTWQGTLGMRLSVTQNLPEKRPPFTGLMRREFPERLAPSALRIGCNEKHSDWTRTDAFKSFKSARGLGRPRKKTTRRPLPTVWEAAARSANRPERAWPFQFI